jgi:hypothetical protein
MSNSIFETLSKINVNEKTEKKGNQTYLSWVWAWAEAKKIHPDIQRTIYEDHNGRNYHTDGKTCWVKVGVTIGGIEHIDYLPIMDIRNSSISLEKVTSFDVNKAIQRSTTKAIALHGLGLYIYAGEDYPDGEAKPDPVPVEKPALTKDIADGWQKAMAYASANKSKGNKFIVDMLSKKYILTAESIAEINKICEAK